MKIGEITLLPIVRTVAACHRGGAGIVGWGTKELIGIVTSSPEGKRAIDIHGEEVPLSRYAEWVPEE